MKKREKQRYNDPWDRDYYETGSTRPPKNHGGLIAFLLVAIIILGGITTGLGMMNIRLFHMLSQAQQAQQEMLLEGADDPVTEGTAESESVAVSENENQARLGLECVSVSEFDRRFYGLPYGCLVMEVLEGSCAEAAGILSGDVIVGLNDQTVSSVADLQLALEHCSPGECVRIRVYRSHTDQNVTLEATLDKAEE